MKASNAKQRAALPRLRAFLVSHFRDPLFPSPKTGNRRLLAASPRRPRASSGEQTEKCGQKNGRNGICGKRGLTRRREVHEVRGFFFVVFVPSCLISFAPRSGCSGGETCRRRVSSRKSILTGATFICARAKCPYSRAFCCGVKAQVARANAQLAHAPRASCARACCEVGRVRRNFARSKKPEKRRVVTVSRPADSGGREREPGGREGRKGERATARRAVLFAGGRFN